MTGITLHPRPGPICDDVPFQRGFVFSLKKGRRLMIQNVINFRHTGGPEKPEIHDRITRSLGRICKAHGAARMAVVREPDGSGPGHPRSDDTQKFKAPVPVALLIFLRPSGPVKDTSFSSRGGQARYPLSLGRRD
jgi:hypothetical protein